MVSMIICPSLSPLQEGFVVLVEVIERRSGSVTVADAVAEQELLSVTVMVCIPGFRAVAVALVWPLLHS